MEIPISKVNKPKTVAVDPETFKMDGRNPANIPSLKKPNSSKPHKKLKVKKMPDVIPALEQLFEADGVSAALPPMIPPEVNDTEKALMEVMQQLDTPTRGKPRGSIAPSASKISDML